MHRKNDLAAIVFFYAFIITHIKEVLLHGKQIQKRKIHYAISN